MRQLSSVEHLQNADQLSSHRSINSDQLLKMKRRADRFDLPSPAETQGYIAVLEGIIAHDQFEIFDKLREADDPLKYATEAFQFLLDCIETRPVDVRKKALLNFGIFHPKTKFEYTDITDGENELLDNSTLTPLEGTPTSRIDFPKQKPNENLYPCLVDDFISSQQLYYKQFHVLTQLFLAPLRKIGKCNDALSVLDKYIPPIMMIERTLSRSFTNKEISPWVSLRDHVNDLRVYIPYISAIKSTALYSEIVECCTTKEFKTEQQSLMNEFFKKHGFQHILPVTVYLDAPVSFFTKYPKVLGDILASLSNKHPDYSLVTACYVNVNQQVKRLESFEKVKEQQQNVHEIEVLFKKQNFKKEGRHLIYFGGLKVIEEKCDWCMCILFNDIFVIARAIVVGKTGKEKDAMMRFENTPSGNDPKALQFYQLTELVTIQLKNFNVRNVIDSGSITNAFMVQAEGIQRHCCCMCLKERTQWIECFRNIE
ncbi:DH domain-containing protein [Entamoeba marina]